MLDVSVSYNRYKFLGDEFLTWLWYIIERDHGAIKLSEVNHGTIFVGNRIVLENNSNDSMEQITIKGDHADLEEGMLALRKGSLVKEINLIYKIREQEWRLSLKGESMSFTGLKTPPSAPVENADEVEGAVFEKITLSEVIIQFLDLLFQAFIKLRVSDDWHRSVVPKMRNWIGGGNR
jgi:hypothetical protein